MDNKYLNIIFGYHYILYNPEIVLHSVFLRKGLNVCCDEMMREYSSRKDNKGETVGSSHECNEKRTLVLIMEWS